MSNTEHLFHGLGYAAVYTVVGLAILALSFYVLDLMTPSSRLGDALRGGGKGGPVTRQGITVDTGQRVSYSAGVVSAAWLLGQGLVIFTAIWTNADSGFGWSLVYTLAFGIVGVLLLAITFFIHDLLTPGKLEEEICVVGPVVPLAWTTAASLVAMSLIVCASIA